MIVELSESLLTAAAKIHSESWKASHASFCSEEFINRHTVENQKRYLQSEINSGKQFYVLIREIPVGIVSIKDDLIENLYVLPDWQGKGCGTELLLFVVNRCKGTPCLWILSNNKKACAFYTKHGFKLTGEAHKLSDTLSEVEMKRVLPANIETV